MFFAWFSIKSVWNRVGGFVEGSQDASQQRCQTLEPHPKRPRSAPPPVAIPLHTLSRPTKTANGGSIWGPTVAGWGFLFKGATLYWLPPIHYWLVVSTHFEKYESNWKSSPNRGENRKYLKPPPSLSIHYSSTIYLPLPVHNFPPQKKTESISLIVLNIYNGVFTPMGTE